MRIIAHERAERGTYCALEGRCEPGGAYRRDPEVNERVSAAIASGQPVRQHVGCGYDDPAFRDADGMRAIARRSGARSPISSKRQPDVDRVFDETRVGTASPEAGDAGIPLTTRHERG